MTMTSAIFTVTDAAPDAAAAVASALHGWPPEVTTLILIAGALLAAWTLRAALMRMVPRKLRTNRRLLDTLLQRARTPLFLGLAVLMLSAALPAAPVPQTVRNNALYSLSAAFMLLLGWYVIIAIDTLTERQLARAHGDIQNDPRARKHATQWQVLRRSSHVVAIMISIAAAIMAFPGVREYGVSLLASAGAAGIVVGLAARPVLSNLLAGIQIAIAQPLRIEDAVVINGQWGWIEEITATYVVVRIWNWQRMVVPLVWLLENPFQNWTRDSPELIGEVHWHVDYTTPVDALRRKLEEIVQETKLWSGKVVALQVTHALGQTMELRALVSARNSGDAWDLRCYVRERMIAFLQSEYPQALPKQRLEINPVSVSAGTRPNATSGI